MSTECINTYEFYGLRLDVATDDAELANEVRRDFAYFHREELHGDANVRIEMRLEAPSYDGLPAVPSSVITPRNICFRSGTTSYIDYFGRGLAVYDRPARHCLMTSADLDLAREMAYLFILSTVGEYLDREALHRIHACGVNCGGRAVLLALPSGGGKSTMALQLLAQPGITLLGEDTPLVDRRGWVHPFPLRMGVRADRRPDIPAEHLRTVERMEFEPKKLIDIAYFADRLSEAVPAGAVLIGQRNLGDVSQIVPLGGGAALHGLLKYMVVGLGIYQGLEFLLERGTWELAGKLGTATSRLRNARALLRRGRAYRFVLGRDIEKNTQTLLDFIAAQAW